MSKYNTGGWVDRRIPEPAMELLKRYGIGSDDYFVAWFGSNLGRYRASAPAEPGVPDQVSDMRKLAELMAQVSEGLEGGRISPTGKAIADEAIHKAHGEFFSTVAQRLRQDLQRAGDALEHSADVLASQARRGPKNKVYLRNVLLDALVKKLREAGYNAEDAREGAREILLRCRISGPYSERAIRRAIGSVKK